MSSRSSRAGDDGFDTSKSETDVFHVSVSMPRHGLVAVRDDLRCKPGHFELAGDGRVRDGQIDDPQWIDLPKVTTYARPPSNRVANSCSPRASFERA
jgi:hypothetical protein